MTMLDSFDISWPVVIRHAVEADVPRLEWFGLMTPFRTFLAADFGRAQAGELIYLVAEVNDFPIGQVEIDLTRFAEERCGYILALRVLPTHQGQGIGSRLMRTAETLLTERGDRLARLHVEQANPEALRLYQRLGYQIRREVFEPWQYQTPEGELRTIAEPEWVLERVLREGR